MLAEIKAVFKPFKDTLTPPSGGGGGGVGVPPLGYHSTVYLFAFSIYFPWMRIERNIFTQVI